MSKPNLVVFDFDDTLVHSDGRKEDFSILSEIKDRGFRLAIASRNDTYHVEEQLVKLGIQHLFNYVMADFRPKVFQIREIVFKSRREGVEFQHIVFIDDYLPHLERVIRDEPDILTLHFGDAVMTLDDVKVKLFSL